MTVLNPETPLASLPFSSTTSAPCPAAAAGPLHGQYVPGALSALLTAPQLESGATGTRTEFKEPIKALCLKANEQKTHKVIIKDPGTGSDLSIKKNRILSTFHSQQSAWSPVSSGFLC